MAFPSHNPTSDRGTTLGMIATTIQYLARNKLYETEKPYSADFEIEENENIKRSNYILSTQPVNIHPIRASDNFNIETNGFCVINAKTNLQAEATLADPDAVEAAYLKELAEILHQNFREYKRLEPLEFVVRKRDERFPSDQLAVVTHEQPACLAHSDYSVDGAIMQLRASFPGQEEYFEATDFDMINVWRPLRGPNDDWPLALCDFTSVAIQRDVVVADLLQANKVAENQVLHPSKKHRWYYVEGQQPENLLVFRNIDSGGKRARAFHCAFFNPHSQSPPRQSCEVRFVAFR